MVRDIRVKEYIFPAVAGAGSPILYTDHVINGDLLRVRSAGNFTGSIQVYESGTILYASKIVDVSVVSGTTSYPTLPLSNSTGSFSVNTQLMFMISGAGSGTANIFGPVTVYYR